MPSLASAVGVCVRCVCEARSLSGSVRRRIKEQHPHYNFDITFYYSSLLFSPRPTSRALAVADR